MPSVSLVLSSSMHRILMTPWSNPLCWCVLVILHPPIVDGNFVADPNHPQYNKVGCVLFVHDNNYERLCDDMHLVGQEIFPDPDNIFSVTLFSGFDLNYENPKQTAMPKWSQYYEWKGLENVSVDEDGCFFHKG